MLGIIIINYNTYEKTVDCINSIKNTYDGDYRIYLLDNASPNKSGEILREKYNDDSSIEVICSNDNLGYARGNNLCIRKAVDEGCDYALISNNDIVYKPHAIDKMLYEIKNEEAFLVGPKVMLPNGNVQKTIKTKAPSFIEYFIYETYIRNLFKNSYKAYNVIPDSATDVYWIAGCTFLVDLKLFKTIDYFDDYTFLYFEEYILSEKAKKCDLRIRYCPDAEVLHYHGFSMGGALNIFTRSANWRSEIYFLRKYWHWNKFMCWVIWKIRVLEVAFNARKEADCRKLLDQYKEGKKYLKTSI
nr:glycosyltransferase family 2 protein [uncultured Butyrivibrio sp.]